jgi:prepilin-type N-terminal cleavage/methylation domain-containing protein
MLQKNLTKRRLTQRVRRFLMKDAGYLSLDPHARLRPGKAAGYTLIEVMVAVAIFGVMVVSLYAGFCSGFAVLRASHERSRATQILLQKVETIHLCSWSQLASFPTNFNEPFEPGATNGTPAFYFGHVSFSAPEVIPDTAEYKTNMQQVTLTVRWTNFNGSIVTPFSEQITTLVARYGSQNFALRK